MRLETDFVVRYLVDGPSPVVDVVDSLLAVDTLLREAADFLPVLFPGLIVRHADIRVRSVAQESPLREAFAAALLVAYQDDLAREVPQLIQQLSGQHVPENLQTTVTVLVLILTFYGVGALKSLVLGSADDGPSKKMLDDLVEELAKSTELTEREIHKRLEDRYVVKSAWKKLVEAAAKFFKPSKKQGDAGIEVNQRIIESDVVKDVPADYMVDHAEEAKLFRSFSDVPIELHAQDRDHTGQGWAAHIPGITPNRLRLKLMPGVAAGELWNRDQTRGDVTIVYQKSGLDYIAKAISLDRLTGE